MLVIRHKTYKIDKQQLKAYLLPLLLILPFCEPVLFSALATNQNHIFVIFDYIFKVWKIVSTLLAFGLMLKKGIIRLEKIEILIGAYLLLFIVACAINGSLSAQVLFWMMNLCGVVLIFNNYKGDKIYLLLDVLEAIFSTFMVINLITILIYPKGMYVANVKMQKNYFLGYYTTFVQFYLFYIVIGAIVSYNKYKKFSKKYIFTCLIIALSSVIVWSAATILTLAVVVVIYALSKMNLRRIINTRNILIGVFLLSVGLVYFNIQYRFSWLIETVLHRNVTLTARTIIWNNAKKMIEIHPILGNGNITFSNGDIILSQAHNQFLDVLAVTGVVGIVVFVFILYCVSKRIDFYLKNKIVAIIMAVFAGYMISFQAEATRNSYWLYAFIIIAYRMPEIIKSHDEKKDEQQELIG